MEKFLPTMQADLLRLNKDCLVLMDALLKAYQANSITTEKENKSIRPASVTVAARFFEPVALAHGHKDLLKDSTVERDSKSVYSRTMDLTTTVFEEFLVNLEKERAKAKPVEAFSLETVVEGKSLRVERPQ